MSQVLKKIAAVVVVLAVMVGTASAGLVTMNCTKDTYVQNGINADASFGNSTQLVLGSGSSAGQIRMVYAAFSVVPLTQIASANDIQSATLKLYSPLVGAVKNGTVDRPRFSWEQNTLTFNNQGTDFASVGTWSIEGNYLIADVTDLVKGWKAGTIVNHGIRIRHYGGTGYTYTVLDSKEETTRGLPPVIEVTYVVPEPATLAILGFGGLLTLRRKSR